MFEVGISARFTADHVMPGMPPPEGELHTHDYRVEIVASRPDLDDRGMVCDLDVLDGVVAQAVAAIEGKNLDVIRPPAAEAVTVEVLARWFHDKVCEALRGSGVEELGVRAWESSVAFGGYTAPVERTSS